MLKADKQTVLNSSIEMIRLYYEKEHKRNKDRIKYGIIAMLIIPIIFLNVTDVHSVFSSYLKIFLQHM